MITGFKLKYGAFLQADILLTSPKSSGVEDAQIPTYQNYESGGFPLIDRIVSGLAQKIMIVNDHFAIAFAGRLDRIASTIHLIRKLTLDSPTLPAWRFLAEFYMDKELTDGNLEFILFSAEKHELLLQHHGATHGPRHPNFRLLAAGSAADLAIDYYHQYPAEYFDVPEEDIVVTGTCYALNQFADYLIKEVDDQEFAESLTTYFGGGFEVATFYGGKFRKISEVLYVFAEAEIDAQGMLMIDPPNFLFKSTYQNDNLIIRSVANQLNEDGHHRKRHDRTFTVAPITRPHESHVQADCQSIPLLGEFLCFIVKVKLKNGETHKIPYIRKYRSVEDFMERGFSALPIGDYLALNYRDSFRQDIQQAIMDRLNRGATPHKSI